MTLIKSTCYGVMCDNCKEIFEDGFTGFSLYTDENYAHERAGDSGWTEDEERHYCSECYKYDDNDNLILNESRFKPDPF